MYDDIPRRDRTPSPLSCARCGMRYGGAAIVRQPALVWGASCRRCGGTLERHRPESRAERADSVVAVRSAVGETGRVPFAWRGFSEPTAAPQRDGAPTGAAADRAFAAHRTGLTLAARPETPGEVRIYERLLPAVPASAGRIRRELDDVLACLEVAAGRREKIALAITDASTNAVLHAYPDVEPGPLYVAADVSGRSLLVTICDWGDGFMPRPDSPPSGFGVSLMRALADSVQIGPHRSGPGTRVALLFRAAAPAIHAPGMSRHLQATMAAHHDCDAFRDYHSALADTPAAICKDTRALHAEARHAVARAKRLCAPAEEACTRHGAHPAGSPTGLAGDAAPARPTPLAPPVQLAAETNPEERRHWCLPTRLRTRHDSRPPPARAP
jgi:serine/threonine-protein kinase RsbW